jgi:hypothetical protein
MCNRPCWAQTAIPWCWMSTQVENEALKFRRMFQQSSHLSSLLKATVNHITPGGGAAAQLDTAVSANAAIAWTELKAVCSASAEPGGGGLGPGSGLLAPHSASSAPFSGLHAAVTGGGGGPWSGHGHSQSHPVGGGGGVGGEGGPERGVTGGGIGAAAAGRGGDVFAPHHSRAVSMMPTLPSDGLLLTGSSLVLSNGFGEVVGGPAPGRRGALRRGTKSMGGRGDEDLRCSVVAMSPPTAACSGRQAALHWMYKVLLQALHTCQVR